VVPLLTVEWLGKPFEGVIAMRETCFEPEAETANDLRGGVRVGAVPFPLLARLCRRAVRRDVEGERGDPDSQSAAFARGEAPGRVGGSMSNRSN